MSESYPYEQLDGRRFQRLAQALIAAEYPNVQCFPLAGQDGGRDAVSMSDTSDKHGALQDAIIFQVKFKEPEPLGSPSSDDLFDWLVGALKKELAKVQHLKQRGASSYVVVTNIPASGHLNVGLRDRMQEWLGNNSPLPTSMWWRDDIDARLEVKNELVWRFNLFRGVDAVRAFFENVFSRSQSTTGLTRSLVDPAVTAILSYLSDQHRVESSLGLKQADLESTPLFRLFVDVPAVPSGSTEQDGKFIGQYKELHNQLLAQHHTFTVDTSSDDDAYEVYAADNPVGAAHLLLSASTAQLMKNVVIEGAPGQGKSTLGQYICQVQRARILGKTQELQQIDPLNLEAPLRLPFRVDLRHLAKWLQKRVPWTSGGTEEAQDPWAASIESYVCAHIRHRTGGLSFSNDDLVAILTCTPSLLVLDGLDEVADIDLRRQVMSAIEETIARLSATQADVFFVVTSRPAAFVKAPTPEIEGFRHFTLTQLPAQLISDYADCWISIRQPPDDQIEEFKTVFSYSMQQSHVADLARNPMQLAILLWLIYVKGWSLPEQRTELYQSYLDKFLDREAEKSHVVRKYRTELLQIHGFLGWTLHARSELGEAQSNFSGDVTEEELRELVRVYLTLKERPTEIVDELFYGVERIFVLVSRIRGRFEFEIQPLREFFAARYLHKTAPYSTSAAPVPGALPERLEALIKNPYWLNVARFFCGWYDEGHLADLSRRIEDLCQSPEYKTISYPRVLIGCVLRDYVMAASPRDTRHLAELMAAPETLRLATSIQSALHAGLGGQSVLPAGAGRTILLNRIRAALVDAEAPERVEEICYFLSENDDPVELANWWLNELPSDKDQRSEWLRRGVMSGAITHLSPEAALSVFDAALTKRLDWIRAVEAGRIDVGAHDIGRQRHFMSALGEGMHVLAHKDDPMSYLLRSFYRCTSQETCFNLRDYTISSPLDKTKFYGPDPLEIRDLVHNFAGMRLETADGCFQYLKSISAATQEILGTGWIPWRAALVAASFPGRRKFRHANFHENSATLYDRARTARVAGPDATFWSELASTPPGDADKRAAVAALAAWAPPDILISLLPQVASWWKSLELWEVIALSTFISGLWRRTGTGASRPKLITPDLLAQVPSDVPDSLILLLAFRCKVEDNALMAQIDAAPTCLQHRGFVDRDKLAYTLQQLLKSKRWEEETFTKIRDLYRSARTGTSFVNPTYSYQLINVAHRFLPHLCEAVLSNQDRYPGELVSAADAISTARVTAIITPLSELAQTRKWFPGNPV
ncbi:NACHT domain-containing protein [Microbispora bryophytorum]|uniref:NACHT domain-containing protein n=1 Tax=Microbispora bryophytorum TaxID=1460882 RepID=UPI0033EC2125